MQLSQSRYKRGKKNVKPKRAANEKPVTKQKPYKDYLKTILGHHALLTQSRMHQKIVIVYTAELTTPIHEPIYVLYVWLHQLQLKNAENT